MVEIRGTHHPHGCPAWHCKSMADHIGIRSQFLFKFNFYVISNGRQKLFSDVFYISYYDSVILRCDDESEMVEFSDGIASM